MKNKKIIIIIYRIETIENGHGMWYDHNGELKDFIGILSPDVKGIPMPYNPKHKKDNKDWYSGVRNLDELRRWFSKEVIKILLGNGYRLIKVLVSEWQDLKTQILFTKLGEYKILEELSAEDVYSNDEGDDNEITEE